MLQGKFARVVGWLDPLLIQEGRQLILMVVQLSTRAHQLRMVAELTAQQQTFHLSANRYHHLLLLRAGDHPVTTARSETKQRVRRPQEISAQTLHHPITALRPGLEVPL